MEYVLGIFIGVALLVIGAAMGHSIWRAASPPPTLNKR